MFMQTFVTAPGSSTCAADSSSGVHGVSKKNGSDKDAHRIFLQGVTIESQKWSSKTPFCQRETGRGLNNADLFY